MYDSMSKEYIDKAIDDLICVFGVKEEISKKELVMMASENPKQCVEKIAMYLGLPVHINLYTVPKHYKQESNIRFETRQLSKTDNSGKGIGGIAAQVFIPEHLPNYGSPKLKGYPISVRISENYFEEPETFIALIAHEMSHVLLKSIWHPMKDNEFYTDLVPIVFGFGKIIDSGRKIETPESIIPFGYLTDTQYNYARERIDQILEEYKSFKTMLLEKAILIQGLIKDLKNDLQKFEQLLKDIYKHGKKLDYTDSSKIVRFFSPDYTLYVYKKVDKADLKVKVVQKEYMKPLHFNQHLKEKMIKEIDTLKIIIKGLDFCLKKVKEDIAVLWRNMSFSYKLAKMFQ